MTTAEKNYSEKYRLIQDVAVSDCYMGSKNCGTCAHCRKYDSRYRPFENSYCTCAEKAPD